MTRTRLEKMETMTAWYKRVQCKAWIFIMQPICKSLSAKTAKKYGSPGIQKYTAKGQSSDTHSSLLDLLSIASMIFLEI